MRKLPLILLVLSLSLFAGCMSQQEKRRDMYGGGEGLPDWFYKREQWVHDHYKTEMRKVFLDICLLGRYDYASDARYVAPERAESLLELYEWKEKRDSINRLALSE